MAKRLLAKLERHLYAAVDIYRRMGRDAATEWNFIFGMLFLNQCSQVFQSACAKIAPRHAVSQDSYDGFFVFEEARWSKLQAALNDEAVEYGSLLENTLVGLTEKKNPHLRVVDHTSAIWMQRKKRIVSDDGCEAFRHHGTKNRLRNEDFGFSDLLIGHIPVPEQLVNLGGLG
jgi:hypothetical protein